jgi:hypothetical protein
MTEARDELRAQAWTLLWWLTLCLLMLLTAGCSTLTVDEALQVATPPIFVVCMLVML